MVDQSVFLVLEIDPTPLELCFNVVFRARFTFSKCPPAAEGVRGRCHLHINPLCPKLFFFCKMLSIKNYYNI